MIDSRGVFYQIRRDEIKRSLFYYKKIYFLEIILDKKYSLGIKLNIK